MRLLNENQIIHNATFCLIHLVYLSLQVDPEYTTQYSDLLKNVAGNIRSANDNFKFVFSAFVFH